MACPQAFGNSELNTKRSTVSQFFKAGKATFILSNSKNKSDLFEFFLISPKVLPAM